MKEEISELVKESLSGTKTKSRLSEQEDKEEDVEDIEIEDEPVDDEEEVDFEMSDVSDEDEDDQEFDMSMLGSDMEDEEEMAPLDMRGASPEELAKVFKAMGEDDGIIISKDDDYIHLSDENEDVEYLIQNESDNSFEDETMESYDEEEEESTEIEVTEFTHKGVKYLIDNNHYLYSTEDETYGQKVGEVRPDGSVHIFDLE